MFSLFSQRHGLVKVMDLKKDDMPIGVSNRLWNKISQYIEGFGNSHPSRNEVIKLLWDRFFKEDIDTLKHTHDFHNSYYYVDQIKSKFFQLEWNGVYDFLEFLLSVKNYKKNAFINELNQIFLDERMSYKIIDCYVTPLISDEEAEEVKIAIDSKYSEVSGHTKKALEFYKKRPDADYKNSIKESISSLEALSRIVLNKPNATLGALSQSLDIHPAFRKAIKELYGWTSDEGGIRHSENGKGDLKTGEAEARFMLIECSALVNYITSKYDNK